MATRSPVHLRVGIKVNGLECAFNPFTSTGTNLCRDKGVKTFLSLDQKEGAIRIHLVILKN